MQLKFNAGFWACAVTVSVYRESAQVGVHELDIGSFLGICESKEKELVIPALG